MNTTTLTKAASRETLLRRSDSPLTECFNICNVAWMLMYGDESHGRGDRRPDANLLRDRTFQPVLYSDFELRRFRGDEFAYFYKPTGKAIATEFWIPAIMPDAFILAAINAGAVHKTPNDPNGHINAYALRFDRLDQRLVPLLRDAGVEVFDVARTLELVKDLIGWEYGHSITGRGSLSVHTH